jgi:hypothetical protein
LVSGQKMSTKLTTFQDFSLFVIVFHLSAVNKSMALAWIYLFFILIPTQLFPRFIRGQEEG